MCPDEIFVRDEEDPLNNDGCPFPDDDSEMCSECSHMSFSSLFTGECDLGIKI
jgi:hypothetical protein